MSNYTISAIELKIKEHAAFMVQLKTELEIARRENPELQLAKELHDTVCRCDHTSECGWFYEINNKVEDWTGYAHDVYLTKARNLTLACEGVHISVEQGLEIFKLVRGY
jgi:hypothetical protein